MNRRMLLALPAGLAASAALRAMASPATPPLDLDVPICRGGLRRIAEVPQREATTPAEIDADFLEKLGLLEGHLLVGKRLLEAKQSRLAVPHFSHPIRELYTWLEPRILARRAPQFERELDAMEAYAEAGNTGSEGAFATAWESLMPKLRATRATVAPAHRASPRFMVDHVALMAFDVSDDYGESIERGRIVNVIEYHDSMGYLMYATALAKAEAAHPGAAPAWAEVVGVLDELHDKVYPDLMPPSRPPMSIYNVRSRYERLRAIAAQLSV